MAEHDPHHPQLKRTTCDQAIQDEMEELGRGAVGQSFLEQRESLPFNFAQILADLPDEATDIASSQAMRTTISKKRQHPFKNLSLGLRSSKLRELAEEIDLGLHKATVSLRSPRVPRLRLFNQHIGTSATTTT